MDCLRSGSCAAPGDAPFVIPFPGRWVAVTTDADESESASAIELSMKRDDFRDMDFFHHRWDDSFGKDAISATSHG